ncbi:hypothetical protein ACIHCM_15310 [Streptomyces sp. NPDC052023]|uniref:hypothetical protein n=1 Tax=Streptomyces sp. NPDC052023 TaxID=3365681 RepID=UPI0037D0083B
MRSVRLRIATSFSGDGRACPGPEVPFTPSDGSPATPARTTLGALRAGTGSTMNTDCTSRASPAN